MKEVECPHHCEWCNNIKNIHEIAEKTTNMDIKCMFADYLNSKEYIIPLSRKTRKYNY